MDLSTQFMGLTLKNPVVASASPFSQKLDGIRKLEDAGASAVVMYSLFEEQINQESQTLDHFLSYGESTSAEALGYFPEPDHFNLGPDEYVKLIADAKKSVNIPIIGSLNGVSKGGWTRYAKLIEQAGADGLELNVYYIPTDPNMTGAKVEEMYVDVLKAVKAEVSIPVAIKIGPNFSSIANVAKRLSDAGANGLVLFNRFFQPDFDLDELTVVPHLVLSDSNELRLPLRWAAILYNRISADIAITSGVHSHTDVIKSMMAGAKVVQVASELLQHGMGRIGAINADLEKWLVEREYASLAQMQGSMSQKNVNEPTAFERANYMKVLQSFKENPTGVSL